MSPGQPRILVFDSGLGGLGVLDAVRGRLPDACYLYALDEAGFPYGAWESDALLERVVAVLEPLLAEPAPDVCVIACNTASTLVLPRLRACFALPFVGTVPAIKPAAERTKSRLVSVLATPATVCRDYTNGLIRDFAAHCEVELVGCDRLASLAEAKLRGEPVDLEEIRAEIAPAFVERRDAGACDEKDRAARRTDQVVLACTHYPFLLDELRVVAPWEVAWIDPAPAIARRVVHVLEATGTSRHAREERDGECGIVVSTRSEADAIPSPASRELFARFGLETFQTLSPR